MATAPAAPPDRIVLDADQQKPAVFTEGTAAVAAAAGSGKTTLLVGRAISLVENGADPRTVMTLAFNKNAATTLQQRLGKHPLTKDHGKAMASTFHAFALGFCKLVQPRLVVLGTNAREDAGRNPQENDAPRKTIRDVAREAWEVMGGKLYGEARPAHLRGITDYEPLLELEPGVRERLFAAGWPSVAGNAAALTTAIRALKLETPIEASTLAEFAIQFRKARQKAGAVDFTDMLLGFAYYLRTNNPQVMTRFRQFRHLQIDEAQDGNELRWYIAKTFADFGEDRSVMAVGDLRQSIAGFAGAQPKLFKGWWDTADQQYTLPRNYRSASSIVEAGNVVAYGEPWNIGGDSIAARTDLGVGLVRVGPVGALSIALEVSAALKNKEYTHKDVTVLSRTRAALETVAFGLRTQGLKVVVRGGGNVWKSMDGRMVRAYLDLGDQKVRDQKAAVQALNRPKRFVSGAMMATWVTSKGELSARLRDDARSRGREARAAAATIEVVEELASLDWETRVQQVQDWLVESLGQDAEGDANAPGRDSDKADLYVNLCDIARTCGSVANLDIAIEAETKLNPSDPDVIELSTIHQSKGDQWGTVYVAVNPKVFPSPRARTDEERAEETRLLYVAVTRPVHTLVVDVDDAGWFSDKIDALKRVAAKSQSALDKASPVEEPMPAPEAAKQLVEPGVTTPATDAPSATGLLIALQQDEHRAERLTLSSLAQPAPGERFVTVRWPDFIELLGAHGFTEDAALTARAGQRVLASTLRDGSRAVVYTSVPPGGREARGNGEDSMKVVLLNAEGRPYSRKQPYAARTRNWRTTLLKRLATAVSAHPSVGAAA